MLRRHFLTRAAALAALPLAALPLAVGAALVVRPSVRAGERVGRVLPAGSVLVTNDGQPFFVIGANYLGPADQAWQMWQADRFDRTRIAADLALVRATGFNTVRVFVQAPLVAELTGGTFGRLDYLLDQADAAGLKVIVTLADYHEPRLGTLAALAGQLAGHYRGRGTILAWDLRNEPQISTLVAAEYADSGVSPLLDAGLIRRYGERMRRDEAAAWRRSGEGRSLTPTRFSDDETYRWCNILAYYREYLTAAGTWARGKAGITSADYANAAESAAWRPLLAAMNTGLAAWLSPQLDAIQAADPAALVTVGFNNSVLGTLPVNDRLALQCFHRFPAVSAAGVRDIAANLTSLRRRFPSTPILLEEFGFANSDREGNAVDPHLTAALEVAVWLELARTGMAGGLKWMFYDFDAGANPRENAFGARRGDGSAKPVATALRKLASGAPWPVSSVVVTEAEGGAGLLALGEGLLVAVAPTERPDLAIAGTAGALVILQREGGGARRWRLEATAPVRVRLSTKAWFGALPEDLHIQVTGTGEPVREADAMVVVLNEESSVVIGKSVSALVAPAAPIVGPPGRVRYFAETGHNLANGFKDYWEANDGLRLFGLPLTEEVVETSPDDGRPYAVQYFERARFEYHPDAPDGYKVQLARLGAVATAARAQEAPFVRVGPPTDSARLYFTATGHTLFGGFRIFWQRNGGLGLFGAPISEEFSERSTTDGRTYTVQYFERARFEYHPEARGTSYEVQLGLLGRKALGLE